MSDNITVGTLTYFRAGDGWRCKGARDFAVGPKFCALLDRLATLEAATHPAQASGEPVAIPPRITEALQSLAKGWRIIAAHADYMDGEFSNALDDVKRHIERLHEHPPVRGGEGAITDADGSPVLVYMVLDQHNTPVDQSQDEDHAKALAEQLANDEQQLQVIRVCLLPADSHQSVPSDQATPALPVVSEAMQKAREALLVAADLLRDAIVSEDGLNEANAMQGVDSALDAVWLLESVGVTDPHPTNP